VMHSKFIFDTALSTAVVPNGKRHTPAPAPKGPLAADMLDKMDRYWRAANYLCIGQIYLYENPLLREPLNANQLSRGCSATGEHRLGKILYTFT